MMKAVLTSELLDDWEIMAKDGASTIRPSCVLALIAAARQRNELLAALEGSQMLLSVALIEAQKANDNEFCVRLKARLKMQCDIIARAKGEA